MTMGQARPEIRCKATKSNGEKCGNAGVPMTRPPLCRFHGGYSPSVQAKADEYARQYELGLVEPLDVPEVRAKKLAAYRKTKERIVRRQMKKAGILEDWEAAAEALSGKPAKPKNPNYGKAAKQRAEDRRRLEALRAEAAEQIEEHPAAARIREANRQAEEVRSILERGGKVRRPRRYRGGEPERLNDALVYRDVAPIPADQYRQGSGLTTGPVYPSGFDIDWAETLGFCEQDAMPVGLDYIEPGSDPF